MEEAEIITFTLSFDGWGIHSGSVMLFEDASKQLGRFFDFNYRDCDNFNVLCWKADGLK
jgi:hypothetical protein